MVFCVFVCQDHLNQAHLSILLKKNSHSQSFTNEEKYTLLTHHFKSGDRYDSFPTTMLHNELSSIKNLGRVHTRGLVTANQKMEVFLNIVSVMFSTYTADGVLVYSTVKNFNRGTDILKEHHKKQYQIDASVKRENFIKIMQEQYVQS